MKSILAVLCYAVLAIAAPAWAAKPAAETAASANADAAKPKPKPKPAQSLIPRPPVRVGLEPVAADTDSCRQTCARKYYFCLSGGDADICPEDWTLCRSRCPIPGATNLDRP